MISILAAGADLGNLMTLRGYKKCEAPAYDTIGEVWGREGRLFLFPFGQNKGVSRLDREQADPQALAEADGIRRRDT